MPSTSCSRLVAPPRTTGRHKTGNRRPSTVRGSEGTTASVEADVAIRPLWNRMTDGADGLLLTQTMVIVVSSELLTALDVATGEIAWDASSPSTAGPTPAAVTREDVVLVAYDSGVQAFDLGTGAELDAPKDVVGLP